MPSIEFWELIPMIYGTLYMDGYFWSFFIFWNWNLSWLWHLKSMKRFDETEFFLLYHEILALSLPGPDFEAKPRPGWSANIWSKSTSSLGFRNIGNHTFQCNTKDIYSPNYIYEIVLKQVMVPDVLKSQWTSWLWPYLCWSTRSWFCLKVRAGQVQGLYFMIKKQK